MARLMSPWLEILWHQDDVPARLALLRRLLALVIAILLYFGPYDVFALSLGSVLEHAAGVGDSVFVHWTQLIRWGGLLMAVCVQAASASRLLFFGTWFSFAVLAYFSASLTPLVWSYNSHLVLLGCLLSAGDLWLRHADARACREFGSFVLGFGQIYVGFFYFQSAISKASQVGVQWFLEGRTAWVFANEIGTHLGQTIAAYPQWFAPLAVAVGIFEISFLFCFVYFPASRKILPMLAVAMHLAFFAVLNISFWHLLLVYPPLFFWHGWAHEKSAPKITSLTKD